MTNTPFSKQIEIVADFYMEYGAEYQDMLAIYDLGFPLAVAFIEGGINEFSPLGISWITDTFIAICTKLGIDQYGEYDSLEEIMEFANAEG